MVVKKQIKTSPVKFEVITRNLGYFYIIGLDEAGRGAMAGALSVGFCVLPFSSPVLPPNVARWSMLSLEEVTESFAIMDMFEGVTDSKLLTPKRRAELYTHIKDTALAAGSVMVESMMIDDVGIQIATKIGVDQAVTAALKQLDEVWKSNPEVFPEPTPETIYVLTDAGLLIENFRYPMRDFIGGELKSLSIAAASIMAKVDRDRVMESLENGEKWGFAQHKGYGTKAHMEAIKKHGLHPQHRTSYGDLHKYAKMNAWGKEFAQRYADKLMNFPAEERRRLMYGDWTEPEPLPMSEREAWQHYEEMKRGVPLTESLEGFDE